MAFCQSIPLYMVSLFQIWHHPELCILVPPFLVFSPTIIHVEAYLLIHRIYSIMEIITHYPHFFTASIYEIKHLLKPDKYKQIIVDSLQFLVKDNRIFLFSFSIMSNHIHLIWQIKPPHLYQDIQRDFLRFIAQKIRFDLMEFHPHVLSQFEVNAKDRKYQFWQRNPLSVELFSHSVFMQNLEYIHWNPVNAGICQIPDSYYWSSASFYENMDQNFSFLSHYKG